MEYIPWFAWIAIVGIVVWGVVQAIQVATRRTKNDDIQNQQQARINELERKIQEMGQARDRNQ